VEVPHTNPPSRTTTRVYTPLAQCVLEEKRERKKKKKKKKNQKRG
jgi:hypothetical protein